MCQRVLLVRAASASRILIGLYLILTPPKKPADRRTAYPLLFRSAKKLLQYERLRFKSWMHVADLLSCIWVDKNTSFFRKNSKNLLEKSYNLFYTKMHQTLNRYELYYRNRINVQILRFIYDFSYDGVITVI